MVAYRQIKEKLGIEITEEDKDIETVDDNYEMSKFEFENAHQNLFIPSEYKPLVKLQIKHVESSLEHTGSDIQNDYNTARDHTYTMLELLTDAIAQCLQYACNSDDPRGYLTTFNDLVKTHGEMKRDLLEMQKIYKEINGEIANSARITQNITQNNAYIGSTSDMIKLIKKAKESSDEELKDIIN